MSPHTRAGMTLLPLGIGDAFSCLYYTSCLAVEAQGCWILVDCPHPVRKMMREGSQTAGVELDTPQVEAVLLTHLHADHASGLEDHAFYNLLALKRRARLLTHPLVAEHLWDRKLRGSMEMKGVLGDPESLTSFEDFFDLTCFEESAPLRFGPFHIECRRTMHPIPTFAMRIEAGGRSLGISSDTSFDPDLIEWLCQADLVVHETNLGIHTPLEALLALPQETKQKLRLTHFPDDFRQDQSELELLVQGRLYRI